MVRPLENQERLSTSEYVNRIRQAERGHGANARDFAYEIHNVSDEERHERKASPEFGEDTYEHADGDPETNDNSPLPDAPASRPASEDGTSNLDITV